MTIQCFRISASIDIFCYFLTWISFPSCLVVNLPSKYGSYQFASRLLVVIHMHSANGTSLLMLWSWFRQMRTAARAHVPCEIRVNTILSFSLTALLPCLILGSLFLKKMLSAVSFMLLEICLRFTEYYIPMICIELLICNRHAVKNIPEYCCMLLSIACTHLWHYTQMEFMVLKFIS